MNYWMYRVVPGLLAVGSLLGAAHPQPQEKPTNLEISLARVEAEPPAPSQKQVYEDIEIYRRLLGKALLSHLHGSENPHAMKSSYSGNPYGTAQSRYYPLLGVAQVPSEYVTSANFTRVNPHAGIAASPFSIEGVYLRPVGIVISAELPMKFAVPEMKPQPEPKKQSDWERERRALNGEKIDKADDIKPRRSPDVLETVLRSLAENGHHLSGLKEGQHVTLALTFRASLTQQCMSCHQVAQTTHNNEAFNRYASSSFITNSAAQLGLETIAVDTFSRGQRPYDAHQDAAAALANKPGPTGIFGNATPRAEESNNHLLLGDLHFKQGRFDEALTVYKKALEENVATYSPTSRNGYLTPKNRQQVMQMLELQNRIIQCHMALKHEDKVEQGVKTLKTWTNLLEKVEGHRDSAKSPAKEAAPAKESALPTKVIITASKQVLDQAGNGQISFDEFAKKVMVEIMTFDSVAAMP